MCTSDSDSSLKPQLYLLFMKYCQVLQGGVVDSVDWLGFFFLIMILEAGRRWDHRQIEVLNDQLQQGELSQTGKGMVKGLPYIQRARWGKPRPNSDSGVYNVDSLILTHDDLLWC